jgi:hypothetical protein
MTKTVCLNMIVKNESSAIQRCLNSVKEIIDHWVIVDTGSTDGTQQIIKDCMRGIPGTLYERPWVNFAYNRTEALDLARNICDYFLFIDADETLCIQGPFDKESLILDCYLVNVKGKSFAHHSRIAFAKDHPSWSWSGAVHESLVTSATMYADFIHNIMIDATAEDGNRSTDPLKFARDAEVLEQELAKDPNNSRTIFYLAQSYGNAGNLTASLRNYQRRTELAGPHDETFWAYYCVGHLQELLKFDAKTIMLSFCNAHQCDPARAEPLERLANFYFQNKCYSLAYIVSKFGLDLPMPTQNTSYVHRWVYQYALRILCADSSIYLNNAREAREHYQFLLKQPGIPQEIKNYSEKRLIDIV